MGLREFIEHIRGSQTKLLATFSSVLLTLLGAAVIRSEGVAKTCRTLLVSSHTSISRTNNFTENYGGFTRNEGIS
jgi:hypothetical protein